MSNANKMKELAGIFRVRLDEPFNIKYKNGGYVEFTPHKFTKEGLIDGDGDGTAPNVVVSLIIGKYTIEKLPLDLKKNR